MRVNANIAALNASDFRPRAIPEALHDELKSLETSGVNNE